MNSNSNNATHAKNQEAVGQPLSRVDGKLKVTGAARYAYDWPQDSMAYAVLVGSTIANGRIKSIDTSKAEKLPGVLSILTYQNAPKLNPVSTSETDARPAQLRLPLQEPIIYYNEQYIVVIVANTLEEAQRAAQSVAIEYAEQAPIVDLNRERSAAVAPTLKVAGKPADVVRGDPNAGLASAEVRVEETYSTPTENHNPMEPHATTAYWEGDRLTVYDATQYTYGVRHSLATTFGIPEENVHVICKFTGGGFGCKGGVWTHVALAAMAARQVRRPVKLAILRQQMFANVGHRPETEQRVTLAAKRDGKLTAIIHEGIQDISAFDEFVEPFTKPTNMMYACPNLRASQRVVKLNVGTPTYMRAPGESSGMFALESALDELAYKLKMDPVQLRLANYAETDPDTNLPWSTKLLKQCYQIGAEKFGWSRRNPSPGTMRDGRYLVGMGMATAVYPVNHFPSSARVIIKQDGTAIA